MLVLKSPDEIEIMAEGGRRLAQILKTLREEVKVGITTLYLEKLSRKLIKDAEAEPAFLGYKPPGSRKFYPCSLCTSINEGVVHGIPSDYKIKDNDLVKLDLGIKYKGFYVDAALTVGVGDISPKAKKLIEVTREALSRGIAEAREEKTIGDIGSAIEGFVKSRGFSVVRSLTGHAIGRELHEDPVVLNFGRRGEGEKLEVGMALAIEPMVAIGSGDTNQLKDESFVTADGSLAAHFEHTVAVTEKGPRVLTRI